jgi:hypothetical protein
MATAGQVRRPESRMERLSGHALYEQGGDRRGGGLEAGGEEHHLAVRGSPWRCANASIGEAMGRISPPAALACSRRAGLPLGDVHRHPQHVAEGHQDDAVVQASWMA